MNKRNAHAMTRILVITAIVTFFAAHSIAQATPRGSSAGKKLVHAWGDPDLMGVWQATKIVATPERDPFNLAKLEALYRPGVRDGVSPETDPALHCVPSAFPRAAMYGWPIQIVQRPGFFYIYGEAFATYRIIPTNGKHLPADYQTPLFMGDSAGKWEGNTFVVDVISFNGRSWLASGKDKPTKNSPGVWPTSEAMHITERWQRVNDNTLEYQARIEDPTMLTAAWETPKITFTKQAANKIYEAKCLLSDPDPNYKVPDPAQYLQQFGR